MGKANKLTNKGTGNIFTGDNSRTDKDATSSVVVLHLFCQGKRNSFPQKPERTKEQIGNEHPSVNHHHVAWPPALLLLGYSERET